jgi:hypothetical protein
MSDWSDAARPLTQKLADFLDLFDLSFLVSGGACGLALARLLGEGGPWPLRGAASTSKSGLDGADLPRFLAGVLLAYVLGLVAFALGRVLRRGILARLPLLGSAIHGGSVSPARLDSALSAHGLSADPLVAAYRRGGTLDPRLYGRLWAELRQKKELAPSYELARRYWVLAATFDGVAIALLLWAAAALGPAPLALAGAGAAAASPAPWLAASLLVVSSLACFHEAGRFHQHQLEEAVTALAWQRRPEQG